MDILFLALLAVWFSGRALFLAYQNRSIVKALAVSTCENIVLKETLDYAQDMLGKDAFESDLGDNLTEYYKKAYQRHAAELFVDV